MGDLPANVSIILMNVEYGNERVLIVGRCVYISLVILLVFFNPSTNPISSTRSLQSPSTSSLNGPTPPRSSPWTPLAT